MCGILGYVGEKDAPEILLSGLKRLEYRGYDSSGIAVRGDDKLEVRRAVGKLAGLERLLKADPVLGRTGIAHTRWATHGNPSVENAHPHTDARNLVAVVHNGIIENHAALRRHLEAEGCAFRSQTDSEVIAQLIGHNLNGFAYTGSSEDFIKAVRTTLMQLKGSFAVGVASARHPNLLIAARRHCPLVIGLGRYENYFSSDVPALLPHTRDVVYLEDGETAVVTPGDLEIRNGSNRRLRRRRTRVAWSPGEAEKDGYRHFMLKEIHEQPEALAKTLLGRVAPETGAIDISEANLDPDALRRIEKIQLLGCGTSWHAGLIAAFAMERDNRIPARAEMASEYRYRDPVVDDRTLVVAVSQSGETADTLAALRMAKKQGAVTVAIANAVGSTITREADGVLMTRCGPEIGVASTKAFTGQLAALYLLNLGLAAARGSYPDEEIARRGKGLTSLPAALKIVLAGAANVRAIADACGDKADFLFLGRRFNYPIALEGALKLKEISYLHAEGYAAGEMKHGPIALIDQGTPVVALATPGAAREKMLANMEEARCRGAEIIAIVAAGDGEAAEKCRHRIEVPALDESLSPFLNVLPLQLFAYEIALRRGCDVDQPRNLAKSVTVE